MTKRRFTVIVALVVLTLSGYLFVKFSYNYIRYEKLLEEKEKIKKELETSKKDINKEKFVRDKLNMKKEGETVYKVVDQEIVEENTKVDESTEVNKEESKNTNKE